MTVVTLTTDFGSSDGFAGTLKGVIWSICPDAHIADISHAVPPQDVLAGAQVLARAYGFFPVGSVHLAVVDPGVGTSRRAIAARIGWHLFVGPDNGLFTPIYDDALRNEWLVEIVELTNPRYRLPEVSRTFHGRDIFAPAAAHLAAGVPLADLGPVVKDPVRIELPQARRTPSGWIAHVVAVDHFGNLASDLEAASLSGKETFRIRGREVAGMVPSYGSREPGSLVALADSEGRLEIAVVNGSAAELLGAKVGDVIEVIE